MLKQQMYTSLIIHEPSCNICIFLLRKFEMDEKFFYILEVTMKAK